MANTVFLHVGVAKTGTTYLQRVLYAHREQLKSAGLLYPGKRAGDQFVASIDLRRLDMEKFDHLKTAGAWDRLAEEVRRFDGDAVVSHETLARCSRAEARRAIASFGGAEVRVVLTVRDLGRQIPAVWQETLKNRATDSYPDFLDNVFVNVESGEHKFFWRPQNVGKVLRRWVATVGADNVTVVTVPAPGAPRDELWKRFAASVNVPDIEITLPTAASNSSLGPAEAELLRHVNAALPEDFSWPRYARLIKRQFAEVRLAQHSVDRIAVPSRWHTDIARRSKQTTRAILRSGCTVVGDLADLEPQLEAPASRQPGELSSDELMMTAAEIVRDLILGASRERRSVKAEDGGDSRLSLRTAARRLALRASRAEH